MKLLWGGVYLCPYEAAWTSNHRFITNNIRPHKVWTFFNFRVSDEGRGHAMAEPIRLQDLFHGRGVTVSRDGAKKKRGTFPTELLLFIHFIYFKCKHERTRSRVHTWSVCTVCYRNVGATCCRAEVFFCIYDDVGPP